MKKLLIVDGNSFIHRAYNALPPLTNSESFPTGAMTGVLNMINNLIKTQKPDKIVIAYDAKGKNFRHSMYNDYKANRNPMDDDLRVQIEPLKEVITAWGLPSICVDGVEADDSISTLAKLGESQGYFVIISTSDKDMRQVVNENIVILDTKDTLNKSLSYYDPHTIFVKNGVYPNRIIDLLALVGDVSDNVPGVPSCGEKTAVKWLKEYDSIDGIMDNADNIKGKVGEKLRESIDSGNLKLSYNLVKIDLNVELPYKNIDDYIGEYDEEKLDLLTKKYELNNFRKALNIKDLSAEKISFNVIDDNDSVYKFLLSCSKDIYIERFNLNDELFVLASEHDCEDVYLFKVSDHIDDLKRLTKKFILSDWSFCGNDVKETLKSLYEYTNDIFLFRTKIKDSRILNCHLNGGKSKNISIEQLNLIYSNIELSELRDKYKLDSKTPKISKMTFDELVEVKCEEIHIAKSILLKEYDTNKKSLELDYELCPVLAMMESNGVKLDSEKLKEHGIFIEEKMKILEDSIYEDAGEKFNISSPKQVGNILFNVLNIESKKKSTAEDVLLALKDDNPIISKILKYRSLSTLNSTYITGLINKLDKDDFLHTTYNQSLTVTGRLSSVDPNLQNIPIKSDDGKKIREAFIAREGYKIVAFDYSQIELVILAHLAQEPALIDAFNKGLDIHSATAAFILDINISDVTDEQRRIFKAINFGLIYGKGYKKLAEELSITNKEAKTHIDLYFNKYSRIKPYFDELLAKTQENLYLETLYGRKIPITDINSNNSMIRGFAERAVKNNGIQGTSADIIKKAMNTINTNILYNCGNNVRMIMQVHDELVFEIKDDSLLENLSEKIKEIMENVVTLSVPLKVNYKIAENWLKAH